MGNILSPEEELERLADNRTTTLNDGIDRLIAAKIRRDTIAINRALSGLADILRHSQALGDLIGRRRMFLEFDDAVSGEDGDDIMRLMAQDSPWIAPRIWMRGGATKLQLLYAANPTVPNVTFSEAVSDIVSREPRLARTAEAVANAYSKKHGFVLAKSVDLQVTEKVQALVAKFLRTGRERPSTIEAIAELGDFKESYARTVFRTNLNSAYTAGRFQQAADPEIKTVMRAFEYAAVTDSVVRRGRKVDNGENHLALHRMIAATDWQGWSIYAPPNGYLCRCALRLISVFELMRRNIIRSIDDEIPDPRRNLNANWVHPNFRSGRPDSSIYLGVGR